MSSRRDFLRSRVIASAGAFVASKAGVSAETKKGEARASGSRPNIVLILANDMGFADLGCYGSEVETPNIYKLAADGLCFRQFYNSPRCRPSRTTSARTMLRSAPSRTSGASVAARWDESVPR